jgi:hypothetical protein
MFCQWPKNTPKTPRKHGVPGPKGRFTCQSVPQANFSQTAFSLPKVRRFPKRKEAEYHATYTEARINFGDYLRPDIRP